MRRFTEVLLLVACTLPPSLFVNGLLLFSPTVNYKLEPRNAVIRGLLVSRQGVCPVGFDGCEALGCCPVGWPCCSDGNCCDPTEYCVLGSNGIIGCCPIGELCSGPAGSPNTITVPSTQTPTIPPIDTLPPPSPTFNSQPLPTITSLPPPPINSLPQPSLSPPTQTTVNPFTTSPLIPTFISSSPSLANPASTSGLPRLSAAGRAQLYRPLLVLVGILLTVMC